MNETGKLPPDSPAEPDRLPQPDATPPVATPAGKGKVLFETSQPAIGVYAAVATFAGSGLAVSVVASILASISAQVRSVVIGVHNFLTIDLTDPRSYVHSGRIEVEPVPIAAGEFGAAAASKNPGVTATGAVGVVTWRLGDSEERLAVMYSVPYDYNLYKNWFKLAIIDGGVQTDKALYEDMYYDKGRTAGKAARADAGTATWQRTLHGQTGTLTGSMESDGHCSLFVEVRAS